MRLRVVSLLSWLIALYAACRYKQAVKDTTSERYRQTVRSLANCYMLGKVRAWLMRVDA